MMENGQSLYSNVLDKIKENKDRVSKGKINAIPFGFPRFDKVFPGLVQGRYYCLTANSGIGKTKAGKNLFFTRPFEFVRNNPQTGISLKVFWFALEESKEEFMQSIMSHYLFKSNDVLVDPDTLMSFNKEIPQDIINKLQSEDAKNYFNEVEKCLEIIDYETNAYGIYKTVRQYAFDNGDLYINISGKKIKVKPVKTDNHIEFESEEGDRYKYFTDYVPHRPDEYVIIVIDHISLISPEKSTPTLHQAMSKLSYDYLRLILSKRFKYIPVVIHQQAAMQEGIENFKNAQLEPSLSGLADNKLLGRDYQIVLGIFAPERFKIPYHGGPNREEGYNIRKLKDNYRSLHIIKNRFGRSNVQVGLAFYGEVDQFYELPQYHEMDDASYKLVKERKFKS